MILIWEPLSPQSKYSEAAAVQQRLKQRRCKSVQKDYTEGQSGLSRRQQVKDCEERERKLHTIIFSSDQSELR